MGQSAFVRHSTQSWFGVSQTVVGAAQSPLSSHSTHWPDFFPDIAHTGVSGVPAQSASVLQGPQVFVSGSQIGLSMGQSESLEHCSQVLVSVLHTGVSIGQFAFLEQGTQLPAFVPVIAHAGVSGVPAQSASVMHVPHVFVVGLQVGSSIGQSASISHSLHAPELVPDMMQIGVSGVVAQSAFDVQGLQVLARISQTGSLAMQTPLCVHSTH
jgi:hypothetical protein